MTANSLAAKFAQSLLLGLLTSQTCFGDIFSLQDSNQDGVLSGRESADLQMLDADGDGEVSRVEFQNAAAEQTQRAKQLVLDVLKERDRNEDGRLSGNESQGLEHCDTNSDGRITEAEIRETLSGADPTLVGKSIFQVREIASDRFHRLDTNQDDRLSGSEAHGSLHFDQNADRRIVKAEYILGVILSAVGDASNPDAAPVPMIEKKKSRIEKETPSGVAKPATKELETVVAEFVTALNDPSSASIVRDRMHPDLAKMIEITLLKYALEHAKASHGAVELPPGRLETKADFRTGEVETEVKLNCERGQLTLVASTLRGKTMSFALNSPEMLKMDQALFRDLQGEALQQRFVETYGDKVQLALSEILDGKDAEAIQMIHPSVIKQIGKEPFEGLFQRIRTRVKAAKSIELESFTTALSEQGIYSFTITYRVTGQSSPVDFSVKFQRDGLQSAMTGYEISEVLNSPPAPLPPTPAPSTPSTPAPVVPDMSQAPSVASQSEIRWLETKSLQDKVLFRMPGKAERAFRDDAPYHSVALPNKKMTFELDIVPLDPSITKDSAIFFKVYKGLLVEKFGAEVLVEKFRTENGFPEQSLVIRMKGGKFAAIRNIMDGNVNYRAKWVGPDMSDDSREYAISFMESIKLIDGRGATRQGTAKSDSNKSSDSDDVPPPPAVAPVTPRP